MWIFKIQNLAYRGLRYASVWFHNDVAPDVTRAMTSRACVTLSTMCKWLFLTLYNNHHSSDVRCTFKMVTSWSRSWKWRCDVAPHILLLGNIRKMEELWKCGQRLIHSSKKLVQFKMTLFWYKIILKAISLKFPITWYRMEQDWYS